MYVLRESVLYTLLASVQGKAVHIWSLRTFHHLAPSDSQGFNTGAGSQADWENRGLCEAGAAGHAHCVYSDLTLMERTSE